MSIGPAGLIDATRTGHVYRSSGTDRRFLGMTVYRSCRGTARDSRPAEEPAEPRFVDERVAGARHADADAEVQYDVGPEVDVGARKDLVLLLGAGKRLAERTGRSIILERHVQLR